MEKRLAVIEVARNANSATQFCGSAMVKVPIGGKKKKLKHNTATTEAVIDSTSPHLAAMNRMATRYAKPAVVALTDTARKQNQVMAATIAATIAIRIANCMRYSSAGVTGSTRQRTELTLCWIETRATICSRQSSLRPGDLISALTRTRLPGSRSSLSSKVSATWLRSTASNSSARTCVSSLAAQISSR